MRINLRHERILVTGGNGFVGKHLDIKLKKMGVKSLYCPSSKNFDLRSPVQTKKLFKDFKPSIVFALAAKVGGILDNRLSPADFYYDNIMIGANTFFESSRHNVKKLINLGAGCGYPLINPMKEEEIWDGYPQTESAPYSLAKKMNILQSKAYANQKSLCSINLIPSNIYGEYDNFNLEKSHVIPALIRKFFFAKKNNENKIEVWGDGTSKRDFIYCGDVADALIISAIYYSNPELPLNIATGKTTSINEVVSTLKKISKYKGKINFDTSKPMGAKERKFSIKNQKKYLVKFRPKYNIERGFRSTYNWFEKNFNNKDIRL